MSLRTSIIQTSGYHGHNFYSLFKPENTPINATLIILHGMQEHSGRYREFTQFLATNNLAVITYDHLGHGKTARNEYELGFFQLENPVEQLVDDAWKMAQLLLKEYPDVPHFVLGHSMGSFITRVLLQKHSERFDGAIIVGTGGRIKGIGFLKALLSIKNKFSPHRRSKFVNNTFSKQNNRKFRKETGADGTNWLSISKNNRNNFIGDPLCGIPFTNNGFYTLISVTEQATKRGWPDSIRKNLPLLFVSGEDDPIGNFGKGVREVVEELKSDHFANTDLKLYPGMRHEILNEEIREKVYADIYRWILRNEGDFSTS